MTTFDQLMAAVEQHVTNEQAREIIFDLAKELSDEADDARAQAEDIIIARDTALLHMDDVQRFSWTDRLADAYQTLAATC